MNGHFACPSEVALFFVTPSAVEDSPLVFKPDKQIRVLGARVAAMACHRGKIGADVAHGVIAYENMACVNRRVHVLKAVASIVGEARQIPQANSGFPRDIPAQPSVAVDLVKPGVPLGENCSVNSEAGT